MTGTETEARRSAGRPPGRSCLRVLVVVNQVTADQSALWEAAGTIEGVELHLVGSAPVVGLDAYDASARLPSAVDVHLLPPWKVRPGKDSLWWRYPGLREVVRRVRPDLVHVHSEVWGLLVGQALGLHPTVVAHGADNQFSFGHRLENAVRKTIIRRRLPRLAGYVSWNDHGALQVVERHPRMRTVVVPGVATPDPSHRAFERTAPLRIGFVGRLSPEKGLATLLGALAQLPNNVQDQLVLEVIGDGEQRGLLTGWNETALRRHGSLSHPDTLARMSELAVLVVPSLPTPTWREQFGRVAVEAMALGVPVIASASGALPEVVADGGRLVPPGDVDALASAIENIVLDPDHHRQLAQRARSRYEATQRPEHHARRLVQFWHKVKPVADG